MEAIQNTIQTMTDHFNTQMAEFQRSLQSANPVTSPAASIAVQFSAFRAFVLSALSGLQQQVEVLARQTDQLEMRSRRKMLLLHGIPDGSNSDLSATVCTSLSSHLKLPNINEDCLSRCQRLGQPKLDKPRPILLKFRDLTTRNLVWFAKTSLKGTGLTLSEFLTKDRHDAFMAARQRFGVSKCWTREGLIMVIGHDGKRHRVSTKAEVSSIQTHDDIQVPSTVVTASSAKPSSQTPKVIKPQVNEATRAKRNVRK